VEEAVEQSLRDLQADYLDLYLIHWPVAFRYSTTTIQPVDAETGLVDVIDVPIKDTWAAMEKLVEKGKVRSIGVSNFTRQRIEELMITYVFIVYVCQMKGADFLAGLGSPQPSTRSKHIPISSREICSSGPSNRYVCISAA
jgi:L-glyceraldehyde reductase